MKVFFSTLLSTIICCIASANAQTYVGSTPAHKIIRDFLEISATDSIDFIRWKVEMSGVTFKLQCQYGLSKPGTAGFSNEQRVAFEGQVSKSGNTYQFKHKGKSVPLLELNENVLHFIDFNDRMLMGNGGYSYALNNTNPVQSDRVNISAAQTSIKTPMVFEGRTPCRELSALLGLQKSEACDKLKWYFTFYADSVTGKPSYFSMIGMGYRRENMARGKWQISTEQDGHIIYHLYFDKWSRSLDLLKGDDGVLFFIDAKRRLFVGNENFSYTLNRRMEEYVLVKR